MKKKSVLAIFVLSVALAITGCGTDPLSKDTMEKISSIGEVELADQSLIEDLEKTYSEMTEKQKNQVKNYVDLKNARSELDDLLKEKEEKERQEEEAAQAQKAAEMAETASTLPYSLAIDFCEALKTGCKDPSSFTLYDVVYSKHSIDGGGYCDSYYVDYSATNSFGGVTRTKAIGCYIDETRYGYYPEDDYEYEGAEKVMFTNTGKNEIESLDVDFIAGYL